MSDWNFFPSGDQAVQYDGSSQYGYKTNPSFRTDTAGAFSFWFRLPELLPSPGNIPLFRLVSEDSGSDAGYFFVVRRHSGYADPTENYLDIVYRGTDGATPIAKSGSTALAANSWYNAVTDSAGKIYVNSAEEVYQRWNLSFPLYTTGWFGGVTATNKAAVIASNRLAGVVTNYGKVDVNDMIYLPGRVFTSTEVSEIYSKGMGADFESLSMYSELASVWPFDGDGNDIKGSNSLTMVGSPTYADV